MNTLSDKIKKLFATYDGQLNSRVIGMDVQKSEDGTEYYEAPTLTLADGGATVVVNGKMEAVSLEAPARAEFVLKKVHPHRVIYRVAFTTEDAVKAEADDSYFNSLIAPVIKEAVRRYNLAFGGPETLRYGKVYCTISDVLELNSEFVEVRFSGDWASDAIVEQA